MAEAGVRWATPPSVIAEGLERYEKLVLEAVYQLMLSWAPQIESSGKAGAPWTDRTGNARQSLFSVVEQGKDRVVLYFSHGMEYGVYLELRWQGRYSIIMRTLESYYGPIGGSLKGLLKG